MNKTELMRYSKERANMNLEYKINWLNTLYNNCISYRNPELVNYDQVESYFTTTESRIIKESQRMLTGISVDDSDEVTKSK